MAATDFFGNGIEVASWLLHAALQYPRLSDYNPWPSYTLSICNCFQSVVYYLDSYLFIGYWKSGGV